MKRIRYSLLSGLIFGLIVLIYCMFTAKNEIAIVVGLFCFLVFSPIAYFKIFWGIKDDLRFKEIYNADINYSSRANHIYNGISVGGKLYLTNSEIIFQTNLINFTQKHECAIKLTDIKNVEFYKTLKLIENGIQIENHSNRIERFVVPKKEKWMERISFKLKNIE